MLVILGATLLVAVVAGNIHVRDGLGFRLKDSQAAAESRALEWGDEMRASADCRIQLVDGLEVNCLIADPQRQADAVIVGDSHANHYYWGLSHVLGEQGSNLMQIARGACSPLYGVALLDGSKTVECNRFIDPVIGHIADDPAIRTVFLGGRWMAYITGREFKDPEGHVSDERLVLADTPQGKELSRREVFEHGLEETLRRLLAAGKRVVFLHAVPELPFNARECVSWTPNRFVSRVPRETCDVAREQVDTRTAEYRDVLDRVLQRYPQVIQLDPQPLLCDAQRCVGRADGVLLYRDDDHLSFGGSQWIARRMQPLLQEKLQGH